METIEQGSPAAPESAPEIVEQVPQSAEGAAPEGEVPPTPPPEKAARPGAKERIDQLTARYREKEREAAAYQAELETYKRQQARAQQFSQLDSAEPKIDQFQDLHTYQRAMADWNVQRSVAIAQAQWEERAQAEAAHYAQQESARFAAQQRTMQENAVLGSKLAPGEKKYPDFRQVVSNPDVPSIRGTPLMELITAADNTADISYALAKDPAQIHRLLQLPPHIAAKEIFRLDQQFTGNGASSAPPPPPQRNGSAASGSKSLEEMGMAEYIKARQQGRNQTR